MDFSKECSFDSKIVAIIGWVFGKREKRKKGKDRGEEKVKEIGQWKSESPKFKIEQTIVRHFSA